jgi:hypothetical protein
MLSGQRAQIANLLESEGESETSKFAVRAALEKLGVDPDDPSKPLPATSDGQGTATRAEAGNGVGGEASESEGTPVDAAAIRAEEAVREGWDEARVSGATLEAIRNGRSESVGPAIHSRSREQDVTARSLAAGLLIGQSLDPMNHSAFRGVGLPGPRDRFTEQDADRGHDLRSMSTPDLFRECLRIDTGKYHQTIDQAFDAVRSAGTSGGTLSYIFGTNVYARLIEGWDTVGDTTLGWCDEEDVPNFLTQEDITVEGSARLERLPRGDTAKHATISDLHETYSIARYAKQFVMDEQDIIDDRLGALMGMPADFGAAARRIRPDFVYSLILENPNLVADSGAVFNSTAVTTSGGHANLGTAVLADAGLKTAISAMGTQRDSENNILNIAPTHLLVPAALEWTAETLTSAAVLEKLFADSSDPRYTPQNLIMRRGLRSVMDDRLGATGVTDPRTGVVRTGSATAWYLVSAGRRTIRVAYRRGTGRRPSLRRFELTQGQWGLGWDINLDIGAAFMDFRPWYMSDGTV